MHPVIADPAGWPEIFCTALASRQHRAISPARRRIGPARAFILVTLTTFPLASSVWSTRLPAFHRRNTPTAFHCGRRSSFSDPAIDRPHGLSGRPPGPTAGLFSGVAENTPGNKLSCSALNLFPSGTHTSALGNCLSSSTATPPSEHTPLRRRCCSELFFYFHRHGTEADRPARLLASLSKPRFPQAGLLLFQRAGATRTFDVFRSG